MVGENNDPDDNKPGVPAFEPVPISDHPHYPFIVIDQFLGLANVPARRTLDP